MLLITINYSMIFWWLAKMYDAVIGQPTVFYVCFSDWTHFDQSLNAAVYLHSICYWITFEILYNRKQQQEQYQPLNGRKVVMDRSKNHLDTRHFDASVFHPKTLSTCRNANCKQKLNYYSKLQLLSGSDLKTAINYLELGHTHRVASVNEAAWLVTATATVCVCE